MVFAAQPAEGLPAEHAVVDIGRRHKARGFSSAALLLLSLAAPAFTKALLLRNLPQVGKVDGDARAVGELNLESLERGWPVLIEYMPSLAVVLRARY